MKIGVVINPAAGQDEAVLAILNRAFARENCIWDVFVTQDNDDAFQQTRKAVSQGVDIVAVYGGDGTVSAVASALVESDCKLAILPGGTGNVIAQELGIPGNLAEAAEIVCSPDHRIVAIDALHSGGHYSFLRIGIGADARMVEAAERDLKDRLGWGAYLLSALAQMREAKLAQYQIELDELSLELPAMTCLVANIGRIGRGNVTLAQGVNPRDGKLDLLVIRSADLSSVAAVGASMLGVYDPSTPLPDPIEQPLLHFQGQRARIAASPPQKVQSDGEVTGETPVSIEVVASALQVLLPKNGFPDGDPVDT